MTVGLYAWLRADCPAASSPRGWCLFQLGLLLLPSSVLLASLLFVPALVLGSLRRECAYWRDRWNWPLLVAGGLMLLGCFSALRADLAWAGLANWLPFFWGFWGFQPYVAEAGARRRAALWMVAGTVPGTVGSSSSALQPTTSLKIWMTDRSLSKPPFPSVIGTRWRI